ncbi:hypothetical protein [Streptomyces sp. NPDC059761]|uniref:hypothetical protein n=1 Tax=Streptomyces sp. NPDC059761 TaxID=3346937 RepID=UPI00364DB56F
MQRGREPEDVVPGDAAEAVWEFTVEAVATPDGAWDFRGVVVLGPLSETELSLQAVQRRDRALLFGGWRGRTRPQISADGRETARFLSPVAGGLVDLFTLVGVAGCMEVGIERLISASDRRLRTEFSVQCTGAWRAPWLSEAMDADPRAVQRLAVALKDYHWAAVTPYWGRINQHLDGEVARCARLIVEGGVGALLDGLRPMAVWKSPVLEIPGYRPLIYPETDFYLSGRSLLLAPSVFCGPVPQLFAEPQIETVVMVYPALNNPVDEAALLLLRPIRARPMPQCGRLSQPSWAAPGQSCCA